MPCPFPGMDPYIERPAIWPDFQHSLTVRIAGALQPFLKPRYAALIDRRVYFDEENREETYDLCARVVRSDRELETVTVLTVLTPACKKAGQGRSTYFRHRDRLWTGSASIVEIDLLRGGQTTVRVPNEKLDSLRPWHYLVAVTRRWPSRQEVYAFPLQRRLPRVGIPLAENDKDVTLDLQAVFTRCWDEGPYPGLLRYDGPPPGTMTPEEVRWCEERLRAAGMRVGGS